MIALAPTRKKKKKAEPRTAVLTPQKPKNGEVIDCTGDRPIFSTRFEKIHITSDVEGVSSIDVSLVKAALRVRPEGGRFLVSVKNKEWYLLDLGQIEKEQCWAIVNKDDECIYFRTDAELGRLHLLSLKNIPNDLMQELDYWARLRC